jgi:predicted nucleic acid-binding protein
MIRALLDTNILLYAISSDAAEAPKRQRARDLLLQGAWATSVQVLQEFYVNATRPQRGQPEPRMTHAQAADAVAAFMRRPVVDNTATVLREAMAAQQRHQISFWDASVIAAARSSGATTLYSEDLSHGQNYDGVTVVNPFLPAA